MDEYGKSQGASMDGLLTEKNIVRNEKNNLYGAEVTDQGSGWGVNLGPISYVIEKNHPNVEAILGKLGEAQQAIARGDNSRADELKKEAARLNT